MPKLAVDPRKPFAAAPRALRVAYLASVLVGVLVAADAVTQGALLGVFSGVGGMVLGLVGGYMFADNGILFLRGRVLGRRVGIVLACLALIAGGLAVASGEVLPMIGGIVTALAACTLIGCLFHGSATEYFTAHAGASTASSLLRRKR